MANWKSLALQKRAAQLEKIPPQWRVKKPPSGPSDLPFNSLEAIRSYKLLTPIELLITEQLDTNILLSKIAGQEINSESVVTAFCKRAAIAQQLIGCCTEMFFEEAIARAKILDEHLLSTGKVVGPLHGLPVSLKDTFEVIGQDTTVGWVGKIGQPARTNSTLVDILHKLGAVTFVKTNIPQSLMMSDSYNHVFGQSYNAFNSKLISGGSSGGEGALIGTRASVVGVGTDIGGSIRIPSNLQGLYGLCPSVGRVPLDDSGRREYIVPPVAGPMASSLSAVETFMSALANSAPWTVDPVIQPIPWRSELAIPPQRPLCLGYYTDDGMVKVQPPMERAVREVVSKLQAAGHEVIPWDTSTHPIAYSMWEKAVLADGGVKCKRLCQLVGEPLVQGMLVGTESNRLSIEESEELSELRVQYQKDYLKRWEDAGIDGLIMPVQPYVGFTPKTWVQSSQYCGYTAHWNWTNYAALTVPVTAAQRDLDTGTAAWKGHIPRNEPDRFNHEQYAIDLIEGMPVCIQVVGGRFGEEKSVAIAKVIESVLEGPEHAMPCGS